MEFNFTINAMDGGQSLSYYNQAENQYLYSIAIDPEGTDTTINNYPGGTPFATIYSKFSNQTTVSSLSAAPMWIMNSPKDNNIYAYCTDGKLLKYNSSFTQSIGLDPVSAGNGSGAAYYNDYLYLATSCDIHRYGALSGTAAAETNYGSSVLSSTLGNATYPGTGGVNFPNHPMHVHSNGYLYIGDTASNLIGISALQGTIHAIRTKKGTADGDTNNGSAYNVLDLPQGYFPTDIESYGTDLAILAIPEGAYTSGAIFRTGRAKLFLWDTFSSSFYKQIDIPDPLATALYCHNGELYIWSGQLDSYVRVSKYTGGDHIIPVTYIPSGSPPFAGAVDASGGMIAWGSYGGGNPYNYVGVLSLGSRTGLFSQNSRHNIARSTSVGNNARVTSLAFADNSNKYPIIGWRDDTIPGGIDRYTGTGTYNSIWRTRLFNIGRKFEVTRVRIPFGETVGAGTSVTLKFCSGRGAAAQTYATINSTNYSEYSSSDAHILDIKQTVRGNGYFYLEFTIEGTTAFVPLFPIEITGRTLND